STFQDLTNPPARALAERVASISPVDGSVVFFTSGGSDSLENANKMARRYWSLAGEPERSVLIRRQRAYHGMHTAGTSLAGLPANAEGYGGLIAHVGEVAWGDAEAT